VRAYIAAAEECASPIIIGTAEALLPYGAFDWLIPMMIEQARKAKVPVAIHLDHGNTIKQVKDALAWGYTSVMYDGSRLPFEENVKNTAFCVQYAHSFGASVEGEIGHVAQGDETAITEVSEAVEFASATKVDALAVSIGTAHGYYTSEPKLDIERCKAIAEALPELPLVLHGGSGTPLADVRKVIENGVAKVNIATEFMDTYLKSSRSELEKLNGKFLPIDKYFDPIVDECAAHAARLMRFFAGM